MAVVIVATLFPVAEHRGEVIEALEITAEKVHASEDDCLLYAMHEGPDGRIVMIEKYARRRRSRRTGRAPSSPSSSPPSTASSRSRWTCRCLRRTRPDRPRRARSKNLHYKGRGYG